jgi:hypothetical protein
VYHSPTSLRLGTLRLEADADGGQSEAAHVRWLDKLEAQRKRRDKDDAIVSTPRDGDGVRAPDDGRVDVFWSSSTTEKTFTFLPPYQPARQGARSLGHLNLPVGPYASGVVFPEP